MRTLIASTLAAAVFASAPAYAMNCGGELDRHVGLIMKMTKSSADKRAALHRMALNGYDYCMAGDAFNGAKLFEMIANQATQ